MSLFIFLYFGLLKLPKETIVVSNHSVLLGKKQGLMDASCLLHLGEHLSPHKSLSIQLFQQRTTLQKGM